jgi:hypothetical protein
MIKLSPGMAVTVEIKTGSRSVIGYLLSPLFRFGTRDGGNADRSRSGLCCKTLSQRESQFSNDR